MTEAEALGTGEKSLAINALAGVGSHAADVLTSSLVAHASFETRDLRELATSLRNQDVLRAGGFIGLAAAQLADPTKLFVVAAAVGGVLYSLGQTLGTVTFQLLAAVGGVATLLVARAVLLAAPSVIDGVTNSLGDVWREPASVHALLAKHVDEPERRLYAKLMRATPFRPITLIGPIRAALLLAAVLAVLVGALAGYDRAKGESSRTTFTLPTYP